MADTTIVLSPIPHIDLTLSGGGVGPQGPPGPGAGAAQKTAFAAVGGHRVVALRSDGTVEHADPTNAAHRFTAVAVTLTAAAAGGLVDLVSAGEVVESSWAWTPGLPVFAGVNGVLTQSAPIAPSWLRQIGVAVTGTSIWVQLHPTIITT